MKKFFLLKHGSQEYRVSLDPIENRNKAPEVALNQVDKDQMILRSRKRAYEYKDDFNTYQAEGGTLKIKAYLNMRAQDDFGKPWDQVIIETKALIVRMFEYHMERVTPKRNMVLYSLADSGHALAAFIIGEAMMKQGNDQAIEWLVKSHNAGYTHALLFLSGYLAQKGNLLGAIACMVISADTGCEISQLAICHTENIDYMLHADSDQLAELLEELSSKTTYSVARYLKVILLLIVGDDDVAFVMLKEIIAKPLKRPKKQDMDESYIKRERQISEYFRKAGEDLLDPSGKLKAHGVRIQVFKSASKSFPFVAFRDVIELYEFI